MFVILTQAYTFGIISLTCWTGGRFFTDLLLKRLPLALRANLIGSVSMWCILIWSLLHQITFSKPLSLLKLRVWSDVQMTMIVLYIGKPKMPIVIWLACQINLPLVTWAESLIELAKIKITRHSIICLQLITIKSGYRKWNRLWH